MFDFNMKVSDRLVLFSVLLLVSSFYFLFLPVSYNFDGTVFANFLRYGLLREGIFSIINPQHLLYFPLNLAFYKILQTILGYSVLEFFHLQLFSLLFGLATLVVLDKMLRFFQVSQINRAIALLLLASSHGFWYFSVEAEVHMPGLFFNTLGIYLMTSKTLNSRRIIIISMLFSIAAGFHLTNGLILFSALAYLILKRNSFVRILSFSSWYFLFLTAQYALVFFFNRIDFLRAFRSYFGAADPYAGYAINYWSMPSWRNLLISVNSISESLLTYKHGLPFNLPIILLFFMVLSVFLYRRPIEKKEPLTVFALWLLPYLVFFSLWDIGNFEFKMNIMLPLLTSASIALAFSRFKSLQIALPLLFFLISFINFRSVFFPASRLETNRNYLMAEKIAEKTSSDSIIVVTGCGSQTSIHAKVYIPYFGHRQVLILDWMIGRGYDLQSIANHFAGITASSRPVYFLSELHDINQATRKLIENHGLSDQEYLDFMAGFDVECEFDLIDGYSLAKLK